MRRSVSPYERLGEHVPPAETGARTHLFREGDTLTGIAYAFLGDWRDWRVVARRNGIRDPRRIEPGTPLIVPAPQPQGGRFESL